MIPGARLEHTGWPGRLRAAVAWVLLSLCLPATATTVVPLAPTSAASAVGGAAAPEAAIDWADVLAQLQANLVQLKSEPQAPAGDERLRLVQRLTEQLRQYLDQQRARQSRPAAPRPSPSPVPLTLDGSPPYSVLEVDRLRDHRDRLQAQKEALDNSLKLLDQEVAASLQALRKSEEGLRLRVEQHERALASNPSQALDTLGALEIAKLQRLQAQLQTVTADEARPPLQVQTQALRAQLEPVSAAIEQARMQQHLAPGTLEALEQEAQKKLLALEQEHRKAAERLARFGTQRNDPWVARAITATQGEMSALGQLMTLNKGNAEIWAYRARSLQASGDARAQREARSVLAGAISQIEGRKRAADEQLRLAQLQQREMQTGLVDGDGAPPGAQPDAASVRAQALQAVVLQIDAQQRVVEHLEHTLVLLQRSLNDLLNQPGHADGANGRGDFWALVSDLPARIWNFELFSVTDTTMVSGRRVTVDYGVTVGKSLGILALFVLGCWLARKLTVVLVRQLTLRFGLSEQLARVIRRWIMSLLVVFVLVAVLRMARVPLAAFAFLGGALAIGIGFGTQNVIKNLISGVIILFERKVRVGDVVTVGGMSGEVTAVDLRATTVRGFDGIESIIPNSTLLEQQVSNWSSGVPRLRRVVRLRGVRGPQTSALRDLMLACASAHPSVLQQPPPLVLLEDLQADAAEWALYYWMRQDDSRSGMQVDSDLRMAMDSALQRSGIALARTRAIVQYSAQR